MENINYSDSWVKVFYEEIMAASLKGKPTKLPQKGIICNCGDQITGETVTQHYGRKHNGIYRGQQRPLGGGDAIRT